MDFTRAVKEPFGYNGQRFVCYFWFVSWGSISLGLHLSLDPLNVEVHVPFGFFRIGVAADG